MSKLQTLDSEQVKRASAVAEAMEPLFSLQKGGQVDPLELLKSTDFLYSKLGYSDISPLSSILLTLRGKPYSISKDFYPLRPMFKLHIPRRRVFKCGRQVAKSSSSAASTVLRGAILPYHDILTITPLCEQIRRYSNNYIRPFIEQSPFKSLVINNQSEQSVSQKTRLSPPDGALAIHHQSSDDDEHPQRVDRPSSCGTAHP
jgi:hypothetical protein